MSGNRSVQESGPTSASKRTSRAQEAALTPVLQSVSQQVQEALTTGGVGARLPIVQRGIEATNAATSQATNQAQENFARAGMNAQDPFALETLGNIGLKGELEAAGIPTAVAQTLIELAPNFALGGTTPIITGQRSGSGKSGGGGISILGGGANSTGSSASSGKS